MNLTDSFILKCQRGTPVLLDDVCAIYNTTVGEIIDNDYDKFQQYLAIILIHKPIIKDNPQVAEVIKNLSDFQYLLMLIETDLPTRELAKEAFYFFLHDDVSFSLDPAQIIVGPLSEKHILTEAQFYEFQRIVRRMYCVDMDEEEIIIDPNDSPSVRALKEKMRENREKLKRAKAKKAQKDKTEIKFSDLVGSVALICGTEETWNMTYYFFNDQLKRMGWHEQFDINNRAAMAGAKLKKSQLKHWIRSISSNDNKS